MKKKMLSLLLAGSVFGACAAEYEFEAGKSESRGASVTSRADASGSRVVVMQGIRTSSARKPQKNTLPDWTLEIPSAKETTNQVQLKFYSKLRKPRSLTVVRDEGLCL